MYKQCAIEYDARGVGAARGVFPTARWRATTRTRRRARDDARRRREHSRAATRSTARARARDARRARATPTTDDAARARSREGGDARAMTPDARRDGRVGGKLRGESGRMSPNGHALGMARNGSFERSDVCFDWSRGSCARADCRFSHEGDAGGNPAAGGGHARAMGSPHRAAAGVCFDYAKGTCKRGEQCRFSHDVAAVAAFAKLASASGSPTGSPTNGRVGVVSIPKPLPIVGALNAAAKPVVAVKETTPAPIARRSGAIDYASAAKAGVTAATEGSFAAALVGKKAIVDPPLPSAPMPKAPMPAPAASEKAPTLTASGASVPTPRFPTPISASATPTVGVNATSAATMSGPAYQFGTGSMLASDQAVEDSATGINFGNKPSATPKMYPKPEFAFGAGVETQGGVPNVNEGFVPPVPAGPPPEANQRAQATVAPGFGFSQPGGFVGATSEKSAPHANAWDRSARPNGGSVAAADGSSQLGSEWDVSGMGMEGLAEDVYSNAGAYDALGGRSPFSGLGYSLFSPAVTPQLESVGQQAQGQPQSMWGGATGFGGSFGF